MAEYYEEINKFDETINYSLLYNVVNNFPTNITSFTISDIRCRGTKFSLPSLYQHNNITMIDLSNLNLSKVQNLSSAFYRAQSANNSLSIDIKCPKISNVCTLFSQTFRYGKYNSIDLSKVDLSGAINTSQMFLDAGNLSELNFGNIQSSNIEDSSQMFYSLKNITNLNLQGFSFNNTNVFQMFMGSSNLVSIQWNYMAPSNSSGMFTHCYKLEDISPIDYSLVNNASGMFSQCSNLSNIIVSPANNITNMAAIFNGCSSLENLDLSSWNSHLTKSMTAMFANCYNLSNLQFNVDTNVLTDISHMFENCIKLSYVDCEHWNTSKITSMRGTFKFCENLSLNLSNWDTSNVVDISEMFYKSNKDTTNSFLLCDLNNVYSADRPFPEGDMTNCNFYSFNFEHINYADAMFANIILNQQNIDVNALLNNAYIYRTFLNSSISGPISINLCNASYLDSTFANTDISSLDVYEVYYSRSISMGNMCRECHKLEYVNMNIPNGTIMNVRESFFNCTNLKLVNFDIVTNDHPIEAFCNCTNLISIKNFRVENTRYSVQFLRVFANCCNLHLNIDNILNNSSIWEVREAFTNVIADPILHCSNWNLVNMYYFQPGASNTITDVYFNDVQYPKLQTINLSGMPNLVNVNFDNSTFNITQIYWYSGLRFSFDNNLSDDSIHSIIRLLLNCNITGTKNLHPANYNSPFNNTNIYNNRYTQYHSQLTAAGWSY